MRVNITQNHLVNGPASKRRDGIEQKCQGKAG